MVRIKKGNLNPGKQSYTQNFNKKGCRVSWIPRGVLWDVYSPGLLGMSQSIWDISDLDYGGFGFILEWYVLGLVVEWGTPWATLGCIYMYSGT